LIKREREREREKEREKERERERERKREREREVYVRERETSSIRKREIPDADCKRRFLTCGRHTYRVNKSMDTPFQN
jgi:hypothetical protein